MVRSSALVAPLVGFVSATAVSASPVSPILVDTRDSNPGCTASSLGKFDWSISEFVYNTSIIFSTPAHQIDSGIVQFNLTNPALTYPAVCQAYSSQAYDFFYGNIIYNCTVPADDAAETATTFTFNAPTGQLNINQTWTCSDQDPTYPDTFTYAGTLNLTLDCTASSYQNPAWTIGQIYSRNTTSCTQENVTIAPYLCEAEA